MAAENDRPDDWREMVRTAAEVLAIEAEGLAHLVKNLDRSFALAVERIFEAKGRVIVTGIGKSGLVGRKIVATLSSMGTPSFFLHPVEALHGDLGMARGEDVVLALSNSGETRELNAILPSLRSMVACIIAFTGDAGSTLARFSDIVIYTGVPREACPLGLAPTASSTAMLAMGDAIAVALVKKRNFRACDFRRNHPGGRLGERLQVPICEVMLTEDDIPRSRESTSVREAIEEMQRKGLGATLVVGPDDRLLGIFTDGDLRRAVRKFGDLSDVRLHEVMTPTPRTISAAGFVADALEAMERHLITVLPVTDNAGRPVGILHLHDLLGKGNIKFTR